MIFKNNLLRIAFRQILPIGILLAGVSSCSVSHSMAGETDGIYFDPSTDQRPVYASVYEEEDYYSPDGDETLVRIGGKYFDKDGNAPVIEKQKSIYETKNPRKSHYPAWGEESNDVKVSVNYFGSPYFNSFGWGIGYGYGFNNWYSPYYSWGNPYRFNAGFYWNSPYYGYSPYYSYWDPFYDPYYYNPYYYNPYRRGYYGYGYGGYNPYYGNYYPGYYRNVKPIRRGRSVSSNDVDVYQNTQHYYNNRTSQNVGSRRSEGQIRRTYSADAGSSSYQRVRERSRSTDNDSSRPIIRYDRRPNSNNSWNSSRSSNWNSSSSNSSYTPRSNSGSGRIKFK